MRFASYAIALPFLVWSLTANPAFAATSSASFEVSVTVVSSCQASAPSAAFGNYSGAAGSPVSVSCTYPTAYSVSLSAPLMPSPARTAVSDKALLNSALLSNAEHNLLRGRLAGAYSVWGARPSQTPEAYGQNADPQYVASGAFADSVMVTVSY